MNSENRNFIFMAFLAGLLAISALPKAGGQATPPASPQAAEPQNEEETEDEKEKKEE